MLEILVGIITAVVTLGMSLLMKKAKCHSECCDIALQTSPPKEEDDDVD